MNKIINDKVEIIIEYEDIPVIEIVFHKAEIKTEKIYTQLPTTMTVRILQPPTIVSKQTSEE